MPAKILDGKWLSKQVHAAVKVEVDRVRAEIGRAPGLGVILIGENPASKTYVSSKEKAARACGLETFNQHLSSEATFEQAAAAIEQFNRDEAVDGILVQLPLPKHLDSNKLLQIINSKKDADGLHPLNQGLLMQGQARLKPCTPLGVMKLIDLAYSDIQGEGDNRVEIPAANLAGKQAVVVGRSILVGKPAALLLMERHATVTVVHSKTSGIEELVQRADIVVAAIGVPNFVKASWIKEGAVVIDVGINRLADGRLTGDVDYSAILPKAGAITPVPGGVGPMTVAMLIYNTLQAYLAAHK